MTWKATLAFPSPTAASVVVKLTSAWQCGATTVLKKAVQRFLLICLFWFVLDIDLEKWGAGSECDRTTTPLIRAECQHLVLKCLCPYSLKGYSHFYMTAVLTAVLTAVFYLSALFA